jgi:predicted RNase H-like nuclease (RuvC/YqgF family)
MPAMGPAEGDDSAHAAERASAYAERTRQLYDARGALAEAVATLKLELERRREETTSLNAALSATRDERDRAVTDNSALRREVEAQRRRIEELEQGLGETARRIEVLQSMKVIRWTGPMRRAVYRWRARRR